MKSILLYLLRAVFLVAFNLELYAFFEIFIHDGRLLLLAWSFCIGISGALTAPSKYFGSHGKA